MKVRLRAATTSLAAVALFALATAIVPAATASAQSSATGSAGGAEPEQGMLAGANDFDCESSHRPVVLLHGTGKSMQASWGDQVEQETKQGPLVKALKDNGYCVFARNYGWADAGWLGLEAGWGYGDIPESAHKLDEFIEDIRARTGSPQVDIVGHSQGGTMAREYLRTGGADKVNPANNKVHTLVMLGPTTHGTTFGGSHSNEPAVLQQLPGSEFLTTLNAGQETFAGIDYTVIASTTDEVITPRPADPANDPSFLNPAPGHELSVHNRHVQTECQNPNLVIRHSRPGLLDNPASLFLVRKALDPDLQGTIPCS